MDAYPKLTKVSVESPLFHHYLEPACCLFIQWHKPPHFTPGGESKPASGVHRATHDLHRSMPDQLLQDLAERDAVQVQISGP
jgi:hypothetical protein